LENTPGAACRAYRLTLWGDEMNSMHLEFDLIESDGLCETAAAYVHYVAGAPTMGLMLVPAGKYRDAFELCGALSSASGAPQDFVCAPDETGHVVCASSELWRPYLGGDADEAALCGMLWNMLGFDAAVTGDACEHRAGSHPHFSFWFDAVSEFAPPSVEIITQQNFSVGGAAARSVYGVRRSVLLSLKHLDAAAGRNCCKFVGMASQGGGLRLYFGDELQAEARLDMSGDVDPTPQRMYPGCETYAVQLPLMLSECGG